MSWPTDTAAASFNGTVAELHASAWGWTPKSSFTAARRIGEGLEYPGVAQGLCCVGGAVAGTRR